MKIVYAILSILLPFILNAQTEGTIIYTQTVSFDFEAPEGMEDMFKNMPKSQSSEKILLFKDSESLYKTHKSNDFNHESRVESDMGESVFNIKIQEPDNQVYMDRKDEKTIAKQDLMGKPFLIEDDIEKQDWKVSSDRRQILDYQCMKATYAKNDSTEIIAWFTPQIAQGIGPENYNGLPGAILMIDINEGEREIVAKEITLDAVDESLIAPPTKGKKVSRDKFKKIEKEKMEEMESISGGTGVRMVIRG